jgi:hypothetical protein
MTNSSLSYLHSIDFSSGLVNVVLLLTTRRLFPDMETVPDFNTQRSKRASVFTRNGITPFTLERSEIAENYDREKQEAASIRGLTRAGSSRSSMSHMSASVANQEGTMEDFNSMLSFRSGESRIQEHV